MLRQAEFICRIKPLAAWSRVIQQTSYSNSASRTELDTRLKQRLTDYKRGKGGRSSFSGNVVTVFGASGSMGPYVINELGKTGSQIIVPYRGDPYDVKDLKLAGDLGQVLFMPYQIENEASIRKAVKYSNVVVNMVGKWNPTKNFSLSQIHVDGAARIARICNEMDVEKLVHFSSMNASTEPEPLIKSPCEFLRTKAVGEKEVRREFPEATILRPSYMYGQRDHFLFYFMKKIRWIRMFRDIVIPLYKKGGVTEKQPIHGTDVARAVNAIINDPSTAGQTYQLVGPNRYLLADLIRYIFMHARFRSDRMIFTDVTSSPYIFAKIALSKRFKPIYPKLSLDRLQYEAYSDDINPNLPLVTDLNIPPLIKLEDVVNWEVKPFVRHGFRWDRLGEYAEPPPPPLVQPAPY